MKMESRTLNDFSEEINLRRAIILLNFKVLGIALGILIGVVIFIATNWLLIKGGETGPTGELVIGPHLELVGQFFIGYTVSFWGSLVGFFYGFLFGLISGVAIGGIYNALVNKKQSIRI